MAELEVDTWLVEVKATVRDEVALTPLQARTAASHPDRFVLCVVPLASFPSEATEMAELVETVCKQARLVSDIGPDAATTTMLVDSATMGEVGLRNAQELRYTVREPRWRQGVSLDDWVASLSSIEPAPASGE